LPFRSVAPSRAGRYASTQWALVDWPPSRQRRSLVQSVVQDHPHNCTRIPPSQGRDPPKSSAVDRVPNARGRRFFSPGDLLAQRARDWSKPVRSALHMAIGNSVSRYHQVVNIGTGQTILVPQVSTRPILRVVGILASHRNSFTSPVRRSSRPRVKLK
jgi:hypothetical protein